MNDKLKKALLALLLACAVCLPGGIAIADVGGFSGDSDYSSGSDYDSGSSYDDDDDDWGSSYSYDDDSSSGSYSSSSSSSDEGAELPDWLVILFGIALVVIAIGGLLLHLIRAIAAKITGSKGGTSSSKKEPVRIQDNFNASKVKPISKLMEKDPSFSISEMEEKLSNWYVRMQNAWTDKDFEPMRPLFTDALFAQLDRQLNDMTKRHQTNYVDKIAVLGVTIKGWYEEGDRQCLVAELSTRITDYTVDDNSGRVVSGDKNKEKFMTYRWILTRSMSATTTHAEGMTTVNCPNCAATLNINQTSRCPYCDSIVTLDDHSWAISAIQGLSQRTA